MNDKNFSITCDIDKGWHVVKEAREKVGLLLSGKSEELAYSCKMVTSELIENALKYGSTSPDEKSMRYQLNIKDNEIKIMVSNFLNSPDDLKILATHIDEIKKTHNPQKLYKNRLMELLENTKHGQTQLGLYRIAYEGKFDIDYTYENDTLTMIATRKY